MGIEQPVNTPRYFPRVSKIVVYTSGGCPRCVRLKEWLRRKGKEFEERDLGDSEVMADLIMRNVFVLSAPALGIRGTFYGENQIFDGNRLVETKLSEILGGTVDGQG